MPWGTGAGMAVTRLPRRMIDAARSFILTLKTEEVLLKIGRVYLELELGKIPGNGS
jgi:hypothetical protein